MMRYDFSSFGELAEIAFEPVKYTLNWPCPFVRFPPRLAMPTVLPKAPPKVQPKARLQFSCSSPLAFVAPLACETRAQLYPDGLVTSHPFSTAISQAGLPIDDGRLVR
jgi:hypothetical protein